MTPKYRVFLSELLCFHSHPFTMCTDVLVVSSMSDLVRQMVGSPHLVDESNVIPSPPSISSGKVQLKETVAESIVEKLRPIRERSLDILKNKDFIDQVLDRGADEARAIAARTMDDVRNYVGFRKR